MARTQVAISSDLVGDLFTISVWDIVTGNLLSSYKSVNSLVVPGHCLDIVRDHYLLCTYASSPILNVWTLAKKDHLQTKMILPGVVGALAVSSDGAYCLAGIDAKIYIWQISSGNLLNVLEKHYQKVTCLRMSTDLSRFISAGEDGLVLVWDFAKTIVEMDSFAVTGGSSNIHDPIKTINHSSAKINDVYLAEASFGGRGHFAVASEDNNCKVYSLESGQLLATILFDSPVRSVVMDRSERFLFCGLKNGLICQTALSDWEAIPATGGSTAKVIDLTFVPEEGESETQNSSKSPPSTFTGHSGAITCLAVTIDGHGLLSGSADKSIKLWHIKSRQSMRTVNFKGAISNLLVSPALNGLFVYDSLEATQSLMEPGAAVSVDISVAVQGPSKGNNANSKGHHRGGSGRIALFDQSKYSRPQTYESMMKKATNPPPPIQPFKRDIYRPGRLTVMSGQSVNAFENGAVWVANDTQSGAPLWPWNDWTMPDEEDIERIFSLKRNSVVSSRLGGKAAKSARKRPTNGSSVNGGDLYTPVDDEEAEEESEESKDQKIARLVRQNEQLYKYSLENIFNGIAK